MFTRKRVAVALLTVVLFFAIHITLVTSQTGLTFQAILQDVWDKTGHRLMTTSWAGAQGLNIGYTETDILRDVYDAVNHQLKTSGSGGGGGTWGSITGTLSSQTDLQTALNAKQASPVTKNDVGLGNVDNTSNATERAATATLTNKQIVPRSTACAVTANHITPNADTTDVCTNYTFSAALTIDNPTATGSNPRDQQTLLFEFMTATAQALTWDTLYSTECGLALPTSTTGDGVTKNRFMFRYATTSSKWCLEASTKADLSRVTTLTSGTTFTCPSDVSDMCEMQMTGASGTLTVAVPSGTPANTQRLRLGFLCTNSQTFAFNAIFVSGPGTALPVTCPSDVTKWTIVELQYSSVLTKWQAVLPSAAATPSISVASAASGGSTNSATAGAGTYTDHTPTYTIPANLLTLNKQLRVCAVLTGTFGATAPTYQVRLKLGATVVSSVNAEVPFVSQTGVASTICWNIHAEAAAGASAAVRTSILNAFLFCCGTADNLTTQPINLATNGSLVVTVGSNWGSNISGNTLTLSDLVVEVLN